MTVSAMTREYWIETVLAWAEVRLAPPQFDECKRALAQGDADLRRALAEICILPDPQYDYACYDVLSNAKSIARKALGEKP